MLRQPEQDAAAAADQRQQRIESVQLSWSSATGGGVLLHESLCRGLMERQFWTPTPIQASTLPAAIAGQRNIVGAAPTGSGKTVAFLLPIYQWLLERQEESSETQEEDDDDASSSSSSFLRALILTPTRELALQIEREANLLVPPSSSATDDDNTPGAKKNQRRAITTGTIVGGLAHVKQYRVLKNNRPPVLVATPGTFLGAGKCRNYVCCLNHPFFNEDVIIAFNNLDIRLSCFDSL